MIKMRKVKLYCNISMKCCIDTDGIICKWRASAVVHKRIWEDSLSSAIIKIKADPGAVKDAVDSRCYREDRNENDSTLED